MSLCGVDAVVKSVSGVHGDATEIGLQDRHMCFDSGLDSCRLLRLHAYTAQYRVDYHWFFSLLFLQIIETTKTTNSVPMGCANFLF